MYTAHFSQYNIMMRMRMTPRTGSCTSQWSVMLLMLLLLVVMGLLLPENVHSHRPRATTAVASNHHHHRPSIATTQRRRPFSSVNVVSSFAHLLLKYTRHGIEQNYESWKLKEFQRQLLSKLPPT